MAEPYLSEIRIMSFNFPPKGWALCNGQLLPINQNQALFSVLGTTYGGDGRVNFALPNLQGRTPIHRGSGFTIGEQGGEENHTLILSELAQHQHFLQGTSNTGTVSVPVGALSAVAAEQPYMPPDNNNAALNGATISTVGGSGSHPNMQPYLVLTFCIALQGIFPSQN